MKPWRLSRSAEASLVEIAEYTARHFGAEQALAYQDTLIDRIDAIARGEPPHPHDCSALLEKPFRREKLFYFREGGHFIILRETVEAIDIIDFLHARSDLPAHLHKLAKG